MLSVISPFVRDKSLTYLTPKGEELTLLRILSGTPAHLSRNGVFANKPGKYKGTCSQNK